MTPFPLKIVTPDGMEFEGRAESVSVRTVSGDVGILAGHIDYVAPLAQGVVTVRANGTVRQGRCDGGILTVLHGEATLLLTAFQWTDAEQ